MPKSVRELVAAMMGTRDGVRPSIQAFPPLDADQIARDLRLDQRAAAAGARGQPAADSSGPDSTELELLAEIERRAGKARDEYKSEIELYDGRIRRAVIVANQWFKIEVSAQSALADFKTTVVMDQNQLHPLRHELDGRQDEFDRFRRTHGLSRLPKEITDQGRIVRIMVMIVFFMSESIVNGMFFAEGSEAGLVGGTLQAAVLSLLNIGLSCTGLRRQ
jgi:hypothetical protein